MFQKKSKSLIIKIIKKITLISIENISPKNRLKLLKIILFISISNKEKKCYRIHYFHIKILKIIHKAMCKKI